ERLHRLRQSLVMDELASKRAELDALIQREATDGAASSRPSSRAAASPSQAALPPSGAPRPRATPAAESAPSVLARANALAALGARAAAVRPELGPRPAAAPKGTVTMEWLGWSFFRLTSTAGRVLLVDPWLGNG